MCACVSDVTYVVGVRHFLSVVLPAGLHCVCVSVCESLGNKHLDEFHTLYTLSLIFLVDQAHNPKHAPSLHGMV